jgi:hypothetical protein
VLRDLLQRGVGARISFGRIVAALGGRGYGLSILIFALPSCLPMPPGIPTVTGLALIVIEYCLGTHQQENRRDNRPFAA